MSPFSSFSTSKATSCEPKSNLIRFLQCVTPVPPSRFLPQSSLHELNSQWQPPRKNETVQYFTLSDLWDCYAECSAYGSGTELHLTSGNILQYYVPYLSAIQLYCNKSIAASRRDIADAESDSWSDDSSSDKLSRSLSNHSGRASDAASDDSGFDRDGSSLSRDKLGYLYLQHFETASPYYRVPLAEKIGELAKAYPGIYTLKNVDLSPASWMSVAWYPIYHIPSRSNKKDLYTCFLTYHSLSSSFHDSDLGSEVGEDNSEWGLLPFGLATYKMHGDIWVNSDTNDEETLMNMNSAACSWLKQLNVSHHDFIFFNYHSAMSSS